MDRKPGLERQDSGFGLNKGLLLHSEISLGYFFIDFSEIEFFVIEFLYWSIKPNIVFLTSKKRKTMLTNKKPGGLSDEIKAEVIEVISKFNIENFPDGETAYFPEFKSKFVYIKRKEFDLLSPIARLKHNGKPNNWDFAIYKYSRDKYDPDEYFFPGIEHVNGTVLGALKAGLEAYPLDF